MAKTKQKPIITGADGPTIELMRRSEFMEKTYGPKAGPVIVETMGPHKPVELAKKVRVLKATRIATAGGCYPFVLGQYVTSKPLILALHAANVPLQVVA